MQDDELVKFRKYRHASSANQFMAARLLIRAKCEQVWGIPPGQLAVFSKPSGQPYLLDRVTKTKFYCSISHSQDFVALAIHPTNPVGIDLEECRTPVSPELYSIVFSPQDATWLARQPDAGQQAFFRLWTAKEALLKCIGYGFIGETDKLKIIHLNKYVHNHPQVVEYASRQFMIVRLPTVAGYEAALCTASPADRSVHELFAVLNGKNECSNAFSASGGSGEPRSNFT